MAHETCDAGCVESVAVVYRRLLVENRVSRGARAQAASGLGYGKLADFLLGVIAAGVLVHTRGPFLLLLIPLAIFVVLVVVHDRVLRRLGRYERVTEFYARGLARIEDQWAGTGETGDRFFDAAHPYARDLDLFGKGSLFELLCTARTRAGEETLARWLLAAAGPEEVRARQAAVAEMQDRVKLRERLFTAGERCASGGASGGAGRVGRGQAGFPVALAAVGAGVAGGALGGVDCVLGCDAKLGSGDADVADQLRGEQPAAAEGERVGGRRWRRQRRI